MNDTAEQTIPTVTSQLGTSARLNCSIAAGINPITVKMVDTVVFAFFILFVLRLFFIIQLALDNRVFLCRSRTVTEIISKGRTDKTDNRYNDLRIWFYLREKTNKKIGESKKYNGVRQ